MNAYVNPVAETMSLEQVHVEMESLCNQINAAGVAVDSVQADVIADLRHRSRKLGQEIILEIDPSILAYVVRPFRLPGAPKGGN